MEIATLVINGFVMLSAVFQMIFGPARLPDKPQAPPAATTPDAPSQTPAPAGPSIPD